MRAILRPALTLFLAFTVLFGALYPAAITGFAQALFPHQAQGSLIEKDGIILGSALIGQNFSEDKYFWSRPSATTPQAYNAMASSGSNMSIGNPDLLKNTQDRLDALRKASPYRDLPVPVDLVTASGSGLDPEISVAAASYQAARIAKARSLSLHKVHELIAKYTIHRPFGFLGETGVNVVLLNLSLDGKL